MKAHPAPRFPELAQNSLVWAEFVAVKEAIGHGIRVKRSKSGAVSFDLLNLVNQANYRGWPLNGSTATRCTLDVASIGRSLHRWMIKSFRDRACQRLWMGEFVKGFSGIEKQALRKLDMLHTARDLNDLRAPPANRLEALIGNRRGQHSIRINDQWRICFIWTEEGPADVEIVDYH